MIPTELTVVTVATNIKEKVFLELFSESCERLNHNLIVLEYKYTYFSHRIKDILLLDFIKYMPDDQIILFSDANDAIILADQKEIIRNYMAFRKPIVFSCEVNFWPDSNLSKRYPKSKSPYRYLNSGAFIGTVKEFREIYSEYPVLSSFSNTTFKWSNQYYWHNIFLRKKHLIGLDHNCNIFFNTSKKVDKNIVKGEKGLMVNTSLEEIENEKKRIQDSLIKKNGRLLNLKTMTYPCHIHFPGPVSKILLQYGHLKKILDFNH